VEKKGWCYDFFPINFARKPLRFFSGGLDFPMDEVSSVWTDGDVLSVIMPGVPCCCVAIARIVSQPARSWRSNMLRTIAVVVVLGCFASIDAVLCWKAAS